MMKNIIGSILLLSMVFTACEDDTFPSFVTTYPVLTVNGESQVIVEQGSAYVDEGADATVGDSEVEVDVDNPVNVDNPGFYTVTYTATNEDGFSVSESRTVIVYEPGEITGLYEGTRVGRSGGPVLITSKGGDQYLISDALGGHYEFERGLGPVYTAPVMITLNGDGTFSAGEAFNDGFGLAVVVTDGQRTEDGSMWTWHAEFPAVAFGFDVKLTKIR